MPVSLLLPTSGSGGNWDGRTVPLTEALRYIRTEAMSRWHRPRCGVLRGTVSTLSFWCGSGYAKLPGAFATDEIPDSDLVCATCEGRALGAGQDDAPDGMPRLAFEPAWQDPPSSCPGSGVQLLAEPLNDRMTVGRCRACGEYERIRALGRGYNAYGYGMQIHRPGPALVPPCPFHAWRRITVRSDDSVGCWCGWVAP